MNKIIYCDLDGVLCDFIKGYYQLTGYKLDKNEFISDDEFFNNLKKGGENFWINLEWIRGAQKLWNTIKPYKPIILSSPTLDESSRIGKIKWVKKHLPGTHLILEYSHTKHIHAGSNRILIDDKKSIIKRWEASGGIGIHHITNTNTISQLKKIL